MEPEQSEEIVNAIINLVKRINNIEKELAVVKAILNLTPKKIELLANNNNRKELKRWQEWARKAIIKIIEWLIIIVSTIVGVKLAG